MTAEIIELFPRGWVNREGMSVRYRKGRIVGRVYQDESGWRWRVELRSSAVGDRAADRQAALEIADRFLEPSPSARRRSAKRREQARP